MSPDILAELAHHFVLICVGFGLVAYGQKIKNSTPLKSNFASPKVFIILGVVMLISQVAELAETYL